MIMANTLSHAPQAILSHAPQAILSHADTPASVCLRGCRGIRRIVKNANVLLRVQAPDEQVGIFDSMAQSSRTL